MALPVLQLPGTTVSPQEPSPASAPSCVAPSSTEQKDWFEQKVHVHDSQLRAYLRNSFPSVRDFDDVVQESYLRAWKARIKHPIHTAKGFLFEIARHIAVDLIRRQKVSPIEQIGNLSGLPVIEDNSAVVERVSENEKIAFVADALEVLPARCREVVMLRKLKNLPRHEVAARLMISEKTVDEHLSRGMKRLEAYFRDRGIDGYFPP